eukprot:gene24588-10202_t
MDGVVVDYLQHAYELYDDRAYLKVWNLKGSMSRDMVLSFSIHGPCSNTTMMSMNRNKSFLYTMSESSGHMCCPVGRTMRYLPSNDGGSNPGSFDLGSGKVDTSAGGILVVAYETVLAMPVCARISITRDAQLKAFLQSRKKLNLLHELESGKVDTSAGGILVVAYETVLAMPVCARISSTTDAQPEAFL